MKKGADSTYRLEVLVYLGTIREPTPRSWASWLIISFRKITSFQVEILSNSFYILFTKYRKIMITRLN